MTGEAQGNLLPQDVASMFSESDSLEMPFFNIVSAEI
jgi:hypothetical protein